MENSCENMDWCFDECEKILSGICFFPLVNKSLEMVTSSRFEPCPGRSVCLSNVDIIYSSQFWVRKCDDMTPDELYENFQVTC